MGRLAIFAYKHFFSNSTKIRILYADEINLVRHTSGSQSKESGKIVQHYLLGSRLVPYNKCRDETLDLNPDIHSLCSKKCLHVSDIPFAKVEDARC